MTGPHSLIALLLPLLLWGCQKPGVDGRIAAAAMGDLSGGPAPRGSFDAEARACGTPGLTEAGAQLLRRQPYLQQVTETGALIRFAAETATPLRVRIFRPGGETLTEAEARFDEEGTGPRQQSARVGGLKPGALHCYVVLDGERRLTGPTGFRTAAPDRVRFIALGDLGVGGPDQRTLLEQLKTVPYELALVTGDVGLPRGRREDYEQHFFGIYRELLRHVPFYAASGNHDYETDDGAVFRRVFAAPENGGERAGGRWYSFDWGPLHVAVLDTERVIGEQAAWLDADLRASKRAWKVVVMHAPAYSSGVQGPSDDVQRHFVPVFRARGVDLVLSGHDHSYERTREQDGVTYVVTGGGGAGTRPVGRSSFTAFSDQVCHFVYGVADADVLRLWAIDATGQTFDTLTLRR